MNPIKRECPQCGGPVEGRPNKIFCSAACRAQHFRDMQDESGLFQEEHIDSVAIYTSAPVPPQTTASVPLPNGYTQGAEQWAAFTQTQQAFQQAALCDRLHRSYSSAITRFLQLDGQAVDEWQLNREIRELDHLSAQYRAHPRLRETGNRVLNRLDDIYELYDKLRGLLVEIQAQPNLGYRHKNTVRFELSANGRAQLRTNILPD